MTISGFENLNGDLPSQKPVQNLKFERADWTSFPHRRGAQQKAGVPADKLRRLVLKELTDNALDTGANVHVGELPDGGYFVEDDGPGIDGTPEEIARLFSIARPMVSTKLLRLPTRGALGNGLRVVAGARAGIGWLPCRHHPRQADRARPERDGIDHGRQREAGQVPGRHPDRDRLRSGDPEGRERAALGEQSRPRWRTGQSYTGKSSPLWYDAPQFHELLSASGTGPCANWWRNLDGCTGARAGEIVAEAGLGRMACARCQPRTGRQAAGGRAGATRKQVTPKRLGAVGPDLFHDWAYATSSGDSVVRHQSRPPRFPSSSRRGPTRARDMRLLVCVNRTPVTGDIEAARDKRDIDLFGCGLHHTVAEAPKDKNFTIRLNITTPYMPITSDGKEPNLEPFLDAICDAVAKAVRKARRPGAKGVTQKDVVLDNLDDAIAAVSGEEGYRFNARQLFYFLRPIVMDETGKELKIGNFTGIITDYENEHGEIALMYREPRGSITHPHRDETITLGTLMVEEYERPAWTFNKLLYIEKEGAQEALKQNRWLERHDCAVMSSKGFSTRAARDLIDKLVEHDEPVEVFCVHDADASGTMIYQTLQEADQGARRPQDRDHQSRSRAVGSGRDGA